jgi:hypothetical protein
MQDKLMDQIAFSKAIVEFHKNCSTIFLMTNAFELALALLCHVRLAQDQNNQLITAPEWYIVTTSYFVLDS